MGMANHQTRGICAGQQLKSYGFKSLEGLEYGATNSVETQGPVYHRDDGRRKPEEVGPRRFRLDLALVRPEAWHAPWNSVKLRRAG